MKTKTGSKQMSELKHRRQRRSQDPTKKSHLKKKLAKVAMNPGSTTITDQDECSLCTYHLLQKNLQELKSLTKLLLQRVNSTRIIAQTDHDMTTVNNVEDTKKSNEEPPTVTIHAKHSSKTVVGENVKPEDKNQETDTTYRWVAEVREGSPGFADDDKCTGKWFNTREAAELDMENNLEKECKERFPYLRWITGVNVEAKTK